MKEIGRCISSCGLCRDVLCEICLGRTLAANGLEESDTNKDRIRDLQRMNHSSFEPSKYSQLGIVLDNMIKEASAKEQKD